MLVTTRPKPIPPLRWLIHRGLTRLFWEALALLVVIGLVLYLSGGW